MATSENNLARSGQVFIEKAVILGSTNKEFDITNLFNEISFTESINDKLINGTITMTESLNLLESIPILSEETVEISFRVPYNEETKTLYFEIFEVADIRVESERTLSYTLHITTREYNQFVKLGPINSFKDTPSEVIVDLMKLVSLETDAAADKIVHIDDTINEQHFVFPALSISECIDQCVKRATNGRRAGHTYKFFENLKGFHFVSMGTLIERDPVMDIFYSQVVAQDEEAKGTLYTDSATTYTVLSRNDSSKMLYDGGYRANIISFDPILKKIVTKEYNFLDKGDRDRTNLIESTPSQSDTFINFNSTDIAETFSYTADLGRNENEYATGKEDYYPERYNDFMLESNASKVMLNNTVVRITIPGTTRVCAGDMINFFPPDQSAVNDPDYDKYLKGKYLVSGIDHLVSSEQYAMILTCIKSGIPEKIEAAR